MSYQLVFSLFRSYTKHTKTIKGVYIMSSAIPFRYLSQEDFIRCGAFDLPMAIRAAQSSIRRR